MPAKTMVKIGRVWEPGRRPINEDRYGDLEDRDTPPGIGRLFVVADGMGGHSSGEVASQLAVDTILQTYGMGAGATPAENLEAAIHAANARVFSEGQYGEHAGMGTTVVAAAIVGNMLYVAHVGDSRAYYLRDEVLRPLTRDHTLVNEQVERNLLTDEEAQRSSQRHVLSRAVGKLREVKVDLAPPLPLRKGDIILLCSDGLCGYVSDSDIEYNLRLALRDPAQAAHNLLTVAEDRGSDDNITILVILIESLAASAGQQLALPAAGAVRGERMMDKTQPIPVRAVDPVVEPPTLKVLAPAPQARRRWIWPTLALVGMLLGVAVGMALTWALLMPTLLQFKASYYGDAGARQLLWQAADVLQGTPAAATATPEVRTVVLTSIATPTPAPTKLPPSPIVQTILAPVNVEVTREVTVVVTATSAPPAAPTETPTLTPVYRWVR